MLDDSAWARPTVSVCTAVALALSAGLLSTPASEHAVHRAADDQSSASDPPYLQVDGRFLAADGEPFFWLAVSGTVPGLGPSTDDGGLAVGALRTLPTGP